MRSFHWLSLGGSLFFAACAQGNDVDGGEGGATSSGGAGGEAGAGGLGGLGGGGGAGGDGGMGGEPIPCDEDPCRLIAPQCGCPSGEKCTVNNQADIVCSPDGTANVGDQCDDIGCKAGTLCVQNKTTPPVISTCMKFCDKDENCNAPGGLCILEINVGGDPVPGVTLCTDNCDPVTNTGCDVMGTSCQAGRETDGQMRAFTQCVGAGNGGQGTPCTTSEDCQPTFGCFNSPSGLQCLKWCNAGNPSCPMGTTCQALDPVLQLDDVIYGACG